MGNRLEGRVERTVFGVHPVRDRSQLVVPKRTISRCWQPREFAGFQPPSVVDVFAVCGALVVMAWSLADPEQFHQLVTATFEILDLDDAVKGDLRKGSGLGLEVMLESQLAVVQLADDADEVFEC